MRTTKSPHLKKKGEPSSTERGLQPALDLGFAETQADGGRSWLKTGQGRAGLPTRPGLQGRCGSARPSGTEALGFRPVCLQCWKGCEATVQAQGLGSQCFGPSLTAGSAGIMGSPGKPFSVDHLSTEAASRPKGVWRPGCSFTPMQEVHAISMGQEPPNLQECCFNLSPVSAKQQTNKRTNKQKLWSG